MGNHVSAWLIQLPIAEEDPKKRYQAIHAATQDEPTRVGDRCFLMGTTHVAHDAVVGNDVTFVNGAGVAGHTVIGDSVILSGSCIVHQFVRIGRMAMMSGGTGVSPKA